jgi:hypothetical protein
MEGGKTGRMEDWRNGKILNPPTFHPFINLSSNEP